MLHRLADRLARMPLRGPRENSKLIQRYEIVGRVEGRGLPLEMAMTR